MDKTVCYRLNGITLQPDKKNNNENKRTEKGKTRKGKMRKSEKNKFNPYPANVENMVSS
jgi:hypothetical protein